MDWKNQLTKTPYLVLFIVLISVGVGTASALITITLSGNVVVTGDLDVDGDLDMLGSIFAGDAFLGNGQFTGDVNVRDDVSVGYLNANDDDFIRFDAGNENIQWDNSETRFRISNSVVTGGHFAAGSVSADDTVNRFGDGTPISSFTMTDFGDLYLADDLEVTDNLYVGGDLDLEGEINCSNCIPNFLSFYTLADTANAKVISIQCDLGDLAMGGGGGVTSNSGAGFGASIPLDKDGIAASDGKDTTGWRVSTEEDIIPLVISVYVICLDFNPLHITP